MQFRVPFGKKTIEFALPAGMTGAVATSRPSPPVEDPVSAVRDAVASPVAGPSLRQLAEGKRSVCIAVTDATRACPDHLLVPPMLTELQAAGVPDDGITLLVAVGTHRASTLDEKLAKLGKDVVERYRVVDHDPANPEGLVAVADGPNGIPFRINRLAVEADLLLATGVVEPHQYAGYSGGGKTVAIGCADEAIIAYTHGPAFLDQDGTRLARLEGNPFQEAVRRVARAAGVAFVTNAVLDDAGELVAVAAGSPEETQDHLARIAGELYTVPIERQVDIAVAGVGHPKDANLYQASRAASYLQFAPTPVVREGGGIILPAACPEGAGEGAGERRFAATMRSGSPTEIIAHVRTNGIAPGEQRAYVMAQVLASIRVTVVGAERPEELESMGFATAPTIQAALAIEQARLGEASHALVVPHALTTLPIVQNR